MLLFELLNKPGEWKEVPTNHPGDFKAVMELPGGRQIEYLIHKGYYPNTVEYEFSDKSQSSIADRIGINGAGDELVIFSTAVEILSKYLQQNPNQVVIFTSEENNRTSLYSRLLKRKLPSGLTYREEDDEGEGKFLIGTPQAMEQLDKTIEQKRQEWENR